MSKYIVTGGAGFIGSTLAKRLVERGDEVFIIDNLSTGFKRNIPHSAHFYKADIGCWNALQELNFPKHIAAIFHLAAQSSGEASFYDPEYDLNTNYKGTFHILKLASKLGVKRFLFASSMSVYGSAELHQTRISESYPCTPLSFYGANKLASEHLINIYCSRHDIHFTSFRLFSVYGPGQNMNNLEQGIVSIYMSYIMRNFPIHVKGGMDRFRDLTFIDDVVDVFLAGEGQQKSFGKTINLGTGEKTTVHQMLETIITSYGKTSFDEWVRVDGHTPGDIKGCLADMTLMKELLGWSPNTRLTEGITKMKEWVDSTAHLWN